MKTCKKCNEAKPMSEFYDISKNSDGKSGKCKSCTRSDVDKNYKLKSKDPVWAIMERMRQREKEERRRNEGKVLTYKRRNHKRPLANTALGNAIRDGVIARRPCEVCGNSKAQGHHEDYSPGKELDVQWLCPRHHSDRHIHLRNCKTLGVPATPIEDFIKGLKASL